MSSLYETLVRRVKAESLRDENARLKERVGDLTKDNNTLRQWHTQTTDLVEDIRKVSDGKPGMVLYGVRRAVEARDALAKQIEARIQNEFSQAMPF